MFAQLCGLVCVFAVCVCVCGDTGVCVRLANLFVSQGMSQLGVRIHEIQFECPDTDTVPDPDPDGYELECLQRTSHESGSGVLLPF